MPTVGEGCQRLSKIWRKPQGLFLSYPKKDRIDHILGHPRYDGVKFIVLSDGNESWDSAIKAQEAWVANPNAAMRLRK
jgi:hypothetical protein